MSPGNGEKPNHDWLGLSAAQALDHLSKRFPAEQFGFTIFRRPLLAFRAGHGKRSPGILITAGAHSGEPSGVLAAIELLNELGTSFSTYVVPFRDPVAWDGYAACLSYASGDSLTVQSRTEIERYLISRGRVVYEDDTLLISLVNEFGFILMDPPPNTAGPRDIERHLRALLRDRRDLVEKLAGRRCFFPSNQAEVEGVGEFGKAFTVIITPEGEVADLNRHFDRPNAPPEVEALRAFVTRLRPGLVLDLHEGQGDGFYFFVPSLDHHPHARRVLEAALGAVRRSGAHLYSLEDLARRIDPAIVSQLAEPIPGVFTGRVHSPLQGSSFGDFCQEFGVSITTETGRWTSLRRRVSWQLVAVKAAIHAFQELASEARAKG